MGRRVARSYLMRWSLLRKAPLAMQELVEDDELPAAEALLAWGREVGAAQGQLVALLLDPDDSDAALVSAVIQAEADAGIGKQPKRTRTIQLQPRDLGMLASISTGRMLTAEALEWLHFPSWRRRFRAYQEAHGNADGYAPAPDLYRRLAAMTAAGYVRTIARTTERARWAHHRLPNAYTLTEAGAELLVTRAGYDRATLWAAESRERSLKNLEHSLVIGRYYAALRSAIEHLGGATISDWRGDHLLDRPDAYDRIQILRRREPMPVAPDATFLLTTPAGTTRVFVEVDQGTRPITSWGDKARAYHAYRGSQKLRQRYGVEDFLLLVIAPTLSRRTRIAEVIVEATRQHSSLALKLMEHLHPTTVRAYGEVIAQVQWDTRRMPHGLVTVPKLSWKGFALWQSAAASQQSPPARSPA